MRKARLGLIAALWIGCPAAAAWFALGLTGGGISVSPIRNAVCAFAATLLLSSALSALEMRALMKAARAAEEKFQMKSALLANISHEIRAPLSGIITYTELALDAAAERSGNQPEGSQEYLGKIKGSAEFLLGVVNDILDMSRIEAGKAELDAIPFNLREVFQYCDAIGSLRAAEKGIRLFSRLGPAVPNTLVGDPTKLRQVLLNLVCNAVKFTDEGSVTLKAEAVNENGNGDGNRDENSAGLLFSVEDTGMGMTPEQAAHIFEPFKQGNGSITRKYGGAGLGLSIARSLVELMGGRLRVETAPGKGSKFTFALRFPLSISTSISTAPVNAGAKAAPNAEKYAKERMYDPESMLNNSMEPLSGLSPIPAEGGRCVEPGFTDSVADTSVMDTSVTDTSVTDTSVTDTMDAAAKKRALDFLERLEPLLAESNLKSLKMKDEVREYLPPAGKQAKALMRQMDEYEFAEALDTLRAIKKSLTEEP